jgi:hypothetical protein
MEKEMKELYGEGLATHADPEPCAGSRKGAGEALAGAHAGRAIEPRKQLLPGADVVTLSGRQDEPARNSERGFDLARSKNSGSREATEGDACVKSPCARTGRSLVRPAQMRIASSPSATGILMPDHTGGGTGCSEGVGIANTRRLAATRRHSLTRRCSVRNSPSGNSPRPSARRRRSNSLAVRSGSVSSQPTTRGHTSSNGSRRVRQ